MSAVRTFKNNIFIFVWANGKDMGTNFAFKLSLFTIIIIKIIFRCPTARTRNINSDRFTITTFNRFNIIIFDKLFIIFMFKLNKRFNNRLFINFELTITFINWFIILIINIINFNKFRKKNNNFPNNFINSIKIE